MSLVKIVIKNETNQIGLRLIVVLKKYKVIKVNQVNNIMNISKGSDNTLIIHV